MHESILPAGDRGAERIVDLRRAALSDLRASVALLADDALGATLEDAAGTDPVCLTAFRRIAADLADELLVAEMEGRVVGTLHLTLMPR